MKHITTLELVPSAPFHFDSTFFKPDHFTTGDNFWEPGIRWQTWRWRGQPLGLKFSGKGTVDNPCLFVDVYASHILGGDFLDTLAAEIRYRYNLDLDLDEFYGLFSGDPVLGPVLRRWRGMRPGHPSSLYEYLIIGIVLQNAAIRRSIQMFQALIEQYGTLLDFDGYKLWAFWEPGRFKDVSEDELRALKVGYRAKSLKRLDDQVVQQGVNEFALRVQDRESQRRALLDLYGVGPATVWYLMFDVFHQWDFFNHVSPWEQKIYSKLFFHQDPETPVPVDQLLAHFEQYGAYKQLAVHYLWEDLWWQHAQGQADWLETLIRR